MSGPEHTLAVHRAIEYGTASSSANHAMVRRSPVRGSTRGRHPRA